MPTAEQGIDILKVLNVQADGRIILLAGCGVNENNIRRIYQNTDIHEYHFSARKRIPSAMQYINRNVYMGAEGADEYSHDITSAERVKATIAAITDI
jgi:copper homeostasis protein